MLALSISDHDTRLGQDAEETPLFTKISGRWMSRLISFAFGEGLFDALAEGPAEADRLAERLGFVPDVTMRLLEGLVAIGLATRMGAVFVLTDDGRRLVGDAPGSLAPLARLWDGVFDQAWSQLPAVARTGACGFERAHGARLFEHLAREPGVARTFDAAMRGLTARTAPRAAALIARDKPALVCDVGGGSGHMLSAILACSPDTQGILFDQPSVVAALEPSKTPRMRMIGGDFFTAVPEAPVHLLGNVLHDWSDDDAARILASVAAAQPADGVVFIVEPILGGPREPSSARAFDLHMMMLTGGRERTGAALEALLGAAGYSVEGLRPVGDVYSLLQARRQPRFTRP